MQHLRSRAGTVVVTAGVFALFSLPVVALAKGPPDVVGGGTDTAQGVASPGANVPNPPPGQLNNSENAVQPAPRPKPTPPGQAKKSQGQAATPAPTGQAPPSDVPGAGRGKGNAYGNTGGRAHKRQGPKTAVPAQPAGEPATGGSGSAPAGGGDEPRGGGDTGGGDKPSRSPDEPDTTGALELPSLSDAPGAAEQDLASALAGETVELPEDASPETLPFTGLQIALLVLAGLAAIAAGMTLRRGVERRQA